MCTSSKQQETKQFIQGYNGIPELETANDLVQRIFSIDMAGEKVKRKVTQEDISEKYSNTLERWIAVYTMRINILLQHCQTHRQDKVNKVFFIWLIDQRKKVMKKLKERDLQKYTDIVEELGIPALRDPHDPKIKYRSRKFKLNVPLKKKRELEDFETDQNLAPNCKMADNFFTEAMDRSYAGQPIKDCRLVDKNNIVFIHSHDYINTCAGLPKIKDRALIVHKLLESYQLLDKMRIEEPICIDKKALASFHCAKYVECLENVQNCLKRIKIKNVDEDADPEDLLKFVPDIEEYGIAYDCSPFEAIFDFVSMVAGATVQCAESLNNGNIKLSINLYGGWHHAHRDEAAGFCYINDIVLGILKLRERFNRILYVDLDVHHGDGVEEAFSSTDRIMTVSFHKFQEGYFPGTGALSDIGKGRGLYHTVNVPLKDGINDKQYCDVFSRIMKQVKDAFNPEVIVCQCGADALAGDPLGGFNLTGTGLSKCVNFVKQWNLPMMLLGGGGYNFVNTSKCWTQYFDKYAPLFDLNIIPSIRKSLNTEEYLENIISKISENMDNLRQQRKIKFARKRAQNSDMLKKKNNKIAKLLITSPTKENNNIYHEIYKVPTNVLKSSNMRELTKVNGQSDICNRDVDVFNRMRENSELFCNNRRRYNTSEQHRQRLKCNSFDFDEENF
eukprot:gene277-901_t